MQDDELVELGSVSGEDRRGCSIFAWIGLGLFFALVAFGVWVAVK